MSSQNPQPDPSQSLRVPNKGCLQLAVYVNYGMLTVHVIRGRQIQSSWNPLSSSFVRLSLVPDDMQRAWCRTEVTKETSHPFYDEKFSFELMEDDSRRRLYISVWHLEPEDSEEEFLGCMSFGLKHILRQSKTVDGWYYLLNEETGQRKHLRVPTSSNASNTSSSTTATTVTTTHTSLETSFRGPPTSSMIAHSSSFMGDTSSLPRNIHRTHNSSMQVEPSESFVPPSTSFVGARSAHHRPLQTMSNTSSRADPMDTSMGPPTSSFVAHTLPRNAPSLMRSSSCASSFGRSQIGSGLGRPKCGQYSISGRRQGLKERDMNSFNTTVNRVHFLEEEENEDEDFECKRRVRDVTEDSDDNSAGSDGSIWIDAQTMVVRRNSDGGFGFSISGSRPAKVCHVDPGSSADRAGLRLNDQIMRINDFPVFASTTHDIANLVRYCRSSKLEMEIQRPYKAMDFFNVSSLSRQSSTTSLRSLEGLKVKRRKLKHFATGLLGKHRRTKDKENNHLDSITSRFGFI